MQNIEKIDNILRAEVCSQATVQRWWEIVASRNLKGDYLNPKTFDPIDSSTHLVIQRQFEA